MASVLLTVRTAAFLTGLADLAGLAVERTFLADLAERTTRLFFGRIDCFLGDFLGWRFFSVFFRGCGLGRLCLPGPAFEGSRVDDSLIDSMPALVGEAGPDNSRYRRKEANRCNGLV